MEESTLIQQAQRGNLSAFNALILQYQRLAYTVAYRMLGESDSAADATQEGFLSAFRHIRDYRGGVFRSWLMRIVTNACYDELRRRKRRPQVSLEYLLTHDPDVAAEEENRWAALLPTPDSQQEQKEIAAVLQHCLNQLPAEQRAVVILRDVQEYDYQEIADVLHLPLGTVKSRLARGRGKLREELVAHHAELLDLQ